MKLRNILNEIDLDALKAQIAKAGSEVDADRAEQKNTFNDVAYAFGNSIGIYDEMLNTLKDKVNKKTQKPRGRDISDDDTPLSIKMKQHGLLTDRGGVTQFAYDYLNWVTTVNMNPPTADNFPKRYRQETIDRIIATEKMGNFPPKVENAFRQIDIRETRKGRDDGIRTQPNLGNARKKWLAKIQNMLPKIEARIRDRNRPR